MCCLLYSFAILICINIIYLILLQWKKLHYFFSCSFFYFLFCECFSVLYSLGLPIMNWINILTFYKIIKIPVVGVRLFAIFRIPWKVIVATLFRLHVCLCCEGRKEIPLVQASLLPHVNCRSPLPPVPILILRLQSFKREI